jgi:hypothetical protein
VEKYGTARQATDDNIIRRMRFACRITKATDTHSEYVILLFHDNSCYVNAPQCYSIRKLPVLNYGAGSVHVKAGRSGQVHRLRLANAASNNEN